MTIQNYLIENQDLYINRKFDSTRYPINFVELELQLMQAELDSIYSAINEQNQSTAKAALEFQDLYSNMVASFQKKIEYIKNVSEILGKLNITYDANNISDFKIVDYFNNDFELNSSSYLVLPKEPVTFKASFVVSGDTLEVYNTNKSVHNSISIKGNFTDIDSFLITILKTDGTVIQDTVDSFANNVVNFDHELANSVSIAIRVFFNNPNLSTLDKQVIYNSFVFNLCLNNYSNYTTYSLPKLTLKVADYYVISQLTKIPTNTFINYNISVDDVNYTIPVGNNVVCKRLDNLNYKEVASFVGLYVKDLYTTENLDEAYLRSLDRKEEKFVVYISKLKDSVVLNNTLKLIDNLGFKYLKYANQNLDIRVNVELYSFDSTLTPQIKNIIGYSKNE